MDTVNHDFPGGSDGKASAYNAGDVSSIRGLERSPGEGNGNPLQYSWLENPMDGGAWWSTVHGVTKSQSDTTEWLDSRKGFDVLNKAEINVFLELFCFFKDPMDVGNLISDASAFLKSILNIWDFTVHVL